VRSLVEVSLTDSHCVELQTVRLAQTRLDVAVGATVSYWVALQTRSGKQVRSLVGVSETDSH
jgi:hypothetical protein